MDDQMDRYGACQQTVAIVAEKLRNQMQKPVNPFILSEGASAHVFLELGKKKACETRVPQAC